MKRIVSFLLFLVLICSCSVRDYGYKTIKIFMSDNDYRLKISDLFKKFDDKLNIEFVDVLDNQVDLLFGYYHLLDLNSAIDLENDIQQIVNNKCEFCSSVTNKFLPISMDYVLLSYIKNDDNKSMSEFSTIYKYISQHNKKINIGLSPMLKLALLFEFNNESLDDIFGKKEFYSDSNELPEMSLKLNDSNFQYVLSGSWMPLLEYSFSNKRFTSIDIFKPVYLKGFLVAKNSNHKVIVNDFLRFLLKDENIDLLASKNDIVDRRILNNLEFDFTNKIIIDRNNKQLIKLNEWLVK